MLVLLQEAESFIGGYLVQPGRQLAAPLEGAPMLVGAQESLLQHILGIVMTGQHAADMPIQGFLVTLNQTSETFFLVLISNLQYLFIHVSSDGLLCRPEA